jgi:hypothetical protein
MAEECDNKIEEEMDSALENYHTAEECDEKFAPIGSGGSGGSGGNSLFPENTSELVIGHDSEVALLTAGQSRQLLVAHPNATLGVEWSNYPWQLPQEVTIATPIASFSFEDVLVII